MAAKAVPIKERKEGALIDSLQTLAEEKDDLNARLREIKDEEDGIEAELIRRFVERGVEGSRGTLCSVTIDRKYVPQMDDYDTLITAVRRRGDYHMLERRISVTAWREVLEKTKKPYPGTVSHEKVTLHRAKLSKRS